MMERRQKRCLPGIRSKLFGALIVFSLLMLLMLWFLQIHLLDFFYEREKFSELDRISHRLTQSLGTKELQAETVKHAAGHHACIRIFSIKDGTAAQIANAEGSSSNCVIHKLSPELLSELYDNAKAADGKYIKRMRTTDHDGGEEEGFHVPGIDHFSQNVNAIYARLIVVDGGEYLMLLDCDLVPMEASIRTLEKQFLWIAVAFLVGALTLAYVLSKTITRPLRAITQKAGRLATGNCAADFDGGGYHEIQELADTLNFAADELAAADRLQKELIANVSHDLRTPLTMIRGCGELMRDIPGENNAENAQVIIDETTRLSELVSDLLDLSKLQAGVVEPHPVVFDLSALVRDVLGRYDRLVRHDGYKIEFENAGEAPVFADRTMILQAVYNLINNALNYTGEDHYVGVRLTLEGDTVRFSVNDHGEGIAPELIGQIWERYYRVEKVHKRAVAGTGLGLSIVKSVLDRHGAKYGIESAVGKGSIFFFELPLAKEDNNGAAAPQIDNKG